MSVNNMLNGFQSTPLIRGETGFVIKANAKDQFQPTPLLRGETSVMLSPSLET